MEITSNEELEQALHEFQRVALAKSGTLEGKRRDDLEGAIKAYYRKHQREFEPGKPSG